MKQILTTLEDSELGTLKNLLEHAGIVCELRNPKPAFQLSPRSFGQELWIMKEWDYARAMELCRSWFGPPQNASGTWVCPACGQRVNGRFEDCWKCGGLRSARG